MTFTIQQSSYLYSSTPWEFLSDLLRDQMNTGVKLLHKINLYVSGNASLTMMESKKYSA